MEELQYFRKEFLAIRHTWCMTWGIVGGIKVTVPCITSKNMSNMLPNNINGQLMVKSKLQMLLLRVVEQRTRLPDAGTLRIMLKRTSVSNREDYCPKVLPSQPDTRSSATHSDSWSCGRDDAARHSQCRRTPRPPALSKGWLSLTKETVKSKCSTPKGVFFTKCEIIRMKITL